MTVALRPPMTQEEFFAWAEVQNERYEFDGFHPVAMTGGTAGHDRVMWGLHRALDRRLSGGRCAPMGPDFGVAILGKAVRYPDALVTCSRIGNAARTASGVVVIFEVVSPSSVRMDRIIKVQEYASVPSIRRYVILESTIVGLTVMERSAADEIWRTTTLTEDGVLRMPEIGVKIPVAEIYERLQLPEDDETPAEER